jgi:hypothetical protein
MKLQSMHPFDETIIGLDNIFHTIGDNSFYVNCPCILATDNIITIGKEYILIDNPKGTGIKVFDVKLMDGYYKAGIVYLFVQDVNSQRIFTVKNYIECGENECKWMLVDLDYFIDRINANNKSSCEKC